jgi:hypothetical protein
MTGLVDGQMMAYYTYLLKSLQAGELTDSWKSFTFGVASARKAVGQFDTGGGKVFTTPWWLGGSNDVTAGGSLEARCVKGKIYIRNVNFDWTWYDRIHARSFIQGWIDIHNNPVEVILEGIGDIFLDKIWDADMPVIIDWHDSRWGGNGDGKLLLP